MDSEDSLHKKPRMSEIHDDKDVVEDIELIKIVNISHVLHVFVLHFIENFLFHPNSIKPRIKQ